MRILYIAGETVPGSNGGSVHVWEVATNLARIGQRVQDCQRPGVVAVGAHIRVEDHGGYFARCRGCLRCDGISAQQHQNNGRSLSD